MKTYRTGPPRRGAVTSDASAGVLARALRVRCAAVPGSAQTATDVWRDAGDLRTESSRGRSRAKRALDLPPFFKEKQVPSTRASQPLSRTSTSQRSRYADRVHHNARSQALTQGVSVCFVRAGLSG